MPDLEERIAALEAAITALTAPETDFMTSTTIEPLLRLTHHPTRITVEASDRPGGIRKLRDALAAHARRERELEEAARKAQHRAAEGTPGAA